MTVTAKTAGCVETRFAAMACAVHIVVVGGDRDLAVRAEHRIHHLESLWSRFRPASDVARCNAAAGRPTTVSPLTVTLVDRAVAGWRRTAGRFDPTVLTALEALGYDRTFEQVSSSVHPPAPVEPAPGCTGITIDPDRSTVTIPVGVRFDPGGIGKGLAADVVATEVIDAGADGVCVNLGGDLRVLGQAPTPSGWIVGLEDPYDRDQELGRVVVDNAGVATTSRAYRTWERAGTQVHHLIDPATGAPAWTDLASVTVLADTAWWAEVLAKAAFIAGPVEGPALISRGALSGVMVDDGGFVHPLAGADWQVTPSWS